METTELTTIRSEITRCSDLTETVYTRLGEIFPSLLSIVSDSDPEASIPSLRELLSRIRTILSSAGDDSNDFFSSFNARNSRLFSSLAERMKALEGIHTRLEQIRTNSEELELISLNAMVISIKSGEKGRAFSCITENLKRLSASMISLSNELMLEEKKLLEKNSGLERSVSSARSRREEADREQEVSIGKTIVPAVERAWNDLNALDDKAGTTVRPIRQAMTGIQLQDIVRQSIDQVLLATEEIAALDTRSGAMDEQLDRISVDIQLLEICEKIIEDVHAHVHQSIAVFSENWQTVHGILDAVEELRKGFLSTYVDYSNRSELSLPALIDEAAGNFSAFISRITLFQREQKGMVQDSASIVSEVKYLRTLFETIRPIISRLQHVRITQQIEVAKNEALHSVRATVDYMSELIYRTESSVDETRKELEQFIDAIESLTDAYGEESRRDSRELDRIKEEKSEFFRSMQEINEHLSVMLSDLRVYPPSFRVLCTEVDDSLTTLQHIAGTLLDLKTSVRENAQEYRNRRDVLLNEVESGQWTIQNDRLRDLVERFTITAHKEAAGKIGGFDVDGSGNDQVQSGDVTLFF